MTTYKKSPIIIVLILLDWPQKAVGHDIAGDRALGIENLSPQSSVLIYRTSYSLVRIILRLWSAAFWYILGTPFKTPRYARSGVVEKFSTTPFCDAYINNNCHLIFRLKFVRI